MSEVGNWIWTSNFDPLLNELQSMAGEEVDDGLLRVFMDELRASDTDATPQRWASCQFYGPRPITAHVGIDQGTDVLFVRLELPDELKCRAETTLRLMQDYSIIMRNRPTA
jgi:hypothetical protein